MARRVNPTEAKELLDQGYTYVDVRSTPEFESGHPAGAVHIPLMERGPAGMSPNPKFLEQFTAKFAKDAKVVVGCEAGGRSAKAVALLEGQGYTALVDQRCGWGGARDASGRMEKGWRDSGLPVATGRS